MIKDLSSLVPEQKIIKLRDRTNTKEEFEVDLFMPGEVGLLYIEHEETILKLFNTDPEFKGRFDKKTYDVIYSLFEMMFKPQHEFMNKKWCRDNIDFMVITLILVEMGKPIYDYLSKMIGTMTTPEKKSTTMKPGTLSFPQ